MENSITRNEKKLWNKDFFLLWQGQLISCLGDALYSMALGFWVLDETGSTSIMAIIMASVSLPRMILGPFAGVIVDRFDRRKIILLGDFIRGLGMIFIGYMAYKNSLEIYMVMIVGVICGICSAFFNPAIGSVIPDLVPSKDLVKANSLQQMSMSISNFIGSMGGGIIYSALGVAIIFLLNGVSYIISSITEIFISIPKIERKNEEFTFKEDFKDGVKFVFGFRGFIILLGVCCGLNFLYAIIFLLMRPMFLLDESLGVMNYAIIGAFQGMGIILSSMVLSKINIKIKDRAKVTLGSLFLQSIFFFVGIFIGDFNIMCITFFIACFLNGVSNTVMQSSMMGITPQDMRGKVMSITMTISMGIHPIGTLVGGVLGDLFEPRNIMLTCFMISIILSIPLLYDKSLKKVLNYDADTQTLDEVRV